MSVTHTAAAPREFAPAGTFSRAVRRVFALLWRAASAASERLANSREVPPEVFRFPPF